MHIGDIRDSEYIKDAYGIYSHHIHHHVYMPRTQMGPLVLIGCSALFWRVDLQK